MHKPKGRHDDAAATSYCECMCCPCAAASCLGGLCIGGAGAAAALDERRPWAPRASACRAALCAPAKGHRTGACRGKLTLSGTFLLLFSLTRRVFASSAEDTSYSPPARPRRRRVPARSLHAASSPPFHAPQLHEHDEVIWNDGVAPESALDFDAPHISAWQGLAMWLGGFAFFGSGCGFAMSTGHPGNKISGDRDLPESGKAALGGYAGGKW